ncbi:cell wall-binding repeat-containing protein [uncultured Serinicoccus sp.]|uniref:cell wall-binding repeat-containing protein n=1 Tax=uncultured Serinicoccus sp. TaxID=735514 RepID=UPI0026101B58|nr:cell wall-binding repeat-containing protein [uncultured Serinicoccus sp.]
MPSARRFVLSALTAMALVVPGVGVGAALADEPSADPEHRTVALDPVPQTTSAEGADVLRGTLDVDERAVTVVGVRWSGPQDGGARMRVEQEGAWGEWTSLEDGLATGPEEDAQKAEGDWGTEGTVLLDADRVQVELSGETQDARIESWTTYVTEQDAATVAELPVPDAEPDGLVVARRKDWAQGMDLIPSAGPIRTSAKMGITLHHTATDAYYAAEDVPAMLRAVYRYHAHTLDWRDVGYNAMVDRYGRVWEGRSGGLENNVQGAHSYGMNYDWFGLSSLGNHEISPVPQAELAGLARTAGWVLNLHGADVGQQQRYTNAYLGWTRTLSTLHGHRDVYATSCPGWQMYQMLGALRTMVAAEQRLDRTAVQRIGGSTRYDVAAGLAHEGAPYGVDTAYVTQGQEIADALGVGPVASKGHAAVLLTRPEAVPPSTMDVLEDMGALEVVLVGGTKAVTPAVGRAFEAQGYAVRRVSGTDRYDTAVQLSYEQEWHGGTVYLASGTNLTDALGGGAAAAHVEAPMLLTRTTTLPPVTAARLAELAPQRVVVLGGTGAVAESVVRQTQRLLPGASIERLGGGNRYQTSALIAMDAFEHSTTAVLAAGDAPVDAMAGTQLAADRSAPLLLVRKGCRTNSVDEVYDALDIRLSRLAGGSGVLSWDAGSTTC